MSLPAQIRRPHFSGPPRRTAGTVAWLAVPLFSGLVLGVLWWLLAPGGLNLLSGNPRLAAAKLPETWLPRDLVLAGLFLLAGCFTAVLLDGKGRGPGAVFRFLSALAGGAAGTLAAWQAGQLAAAWWGQAADPGSGFSLRSYAVLFFWTGSTALVTFLLNVFWPAPKAGAAETAGVRR